VGLHWCGTASYIGLIAGSIPVTQITTMKDYGLEVGTTVKYIGLNADPNDKMQDLFERVEQAAENETDYRNSFLNEIVIDENKDGSYAVNMFFIEWGPFVNDIDFAGGVEMMDKLPKEAMSGSLKAFTKGNKFGEKQYLDGGNGNNSRPR
jgi:hypothetical protein